MNFRPAALFAAIGLVGGILTTALLSERLAYAGTGDIVLTTPVTSSAVVGQICVRSSSVDYEARVATLSFKTCTGTALANYVYLDTATYTLNVTATGYRLDRPFAPAVVGTTLTFTQVATDLSTLPAGMKTFARRVVSGN
ncbi:MAG TPA: hypothetical protein VJP78_01585 [Thermoleophilia bacterium]|nr:hypothetical protein [Thermoleophilia bacterium]